MGYYDRKMYRDKVKTTLNDFRSVAVDMKKAMNVAKSVREISQSDLADLENDMELACAKIEKILESLHAGQNLVDKDGR